MKLYYNDAEGKINSSRLPSSGANQYNGNISAIVYGTSGSDTPISGYGFSYDKLNRLKNGLYGEGTTLGTNTAKFSEVVSLYDANGNIKKLDRYSKGTRIDQLTYTYEEGSNRLQKVVDGAVNSEGYEALHSGNYAYDANGNMTYDPAKGTTIKYNYLNLPQEIIFASKGKIFYHYDAAGNKLAKHLENDVSNLDKTTDYIAGVIYEDDALVQVATEEGRLVPNGGKFEYEYNLQDHLGNTRVTFAVNASGATEIRQSSHYYPFGLLYGQKNHTATNTNYNQNKYLYNGKELQSDGFGDVSLDWYDYGARFYDPSLGRFTTIDPLSEDYYLYSPYGYCAGNPIACRDENGEWINFVVGAAVGAAMDYAVQVGSNYIEGKSGSEAWTDVNYASIGLSAAAGATGAGIASGFTKLTKVAKVAQLASKSQTAAKVVQGTANVAGDITASVAGSVIQGKEITVEGVVSDVVGGAAGRKISTSVTNKAQPKQKVLNNQADRAQRVASGSSRQSRVNNAATTSQNASNYQTSTNVKAAVAGGVGSNTTSKTVQTVITPKEEDR